jgi:hypothetical protein
MACGFPDGYRLAPNVGPIGLFYMSPNALFTIAKDPYSRTLSASSVLRVRRLPGPSPAEGRGDRPDDG